MKGLIIKDFLYLREMKRTLVIFGAVFLFLLFVSKSDGSGVNFFAAFAVAMTLLLDLSLFSYDDAAKWDLYAGALPVDRNFTVAEKYLMTLILGVGFSVFFGVISFLILGSFTWDDFLNYYANFGAALAILSVLIPLVYRFGVQKARLALMTIFLLIVAVVILLKHVVGLTVTDADIMLWLKLSPLFLLILFFGSFLLSCRVYRRKEF